MFKSFTLVSALLYNNTVWLQSSTREPQWLQCSKLKYLEIPNVQFRTGNCKIHSHTYVTAHWKTDQNVGTHTWTIPFSPN